MLLKSAITMLVLLPAMASCDSYPRYRYRLTVTVDTPEGRKQGSTIIEVRTRTEPLPGPSIHRDAVGEAAVIDLGKRGLLFALPRGETFYNWAGELYATLAPPPPRGLSISEVATYSVKAAQSAKAPIVLPRYFPGNRELPLSGYPLLVRFRDPSDHLTLERVDPDNLASSFGSGVKLRKITVQITQDKPQRRVIQYLPWLATVKGPFNKDHMKVRDPSEFQNDLSSRSFDPEIQ